MSPGSVLFVSGTPSHYPAGPPRLSSRRVAGLGSRKAHAWNSLCVRMYTSFPVPGLSAWGQRHKSQLPREASN